MPSDSLSSVSLFRSPSHTLPLFPFITIIGMAGSEDGRKGQQPLPTDILSGKIRSKRRAYLIHSVCLMIMC